MQNSHREAQAKDELKKKLGDTQIIPVIENQQIQDVSSFVPKNIWDEHS